MNESMVILSLIALSIHNFEESLSMDKYSKNIRKSYKPITAGEFRFAVLIITAIFYVAVFLYLLFPLNFLIKYFYFGFLGAMILNLFSHILPTIVLKKYSPGLITSIFLVVPTNLYLIIQGFKSGILGAFGLILACLFMSLLLLALIPLLFKLSKFSSAE